MTERAAINSGRVAAPHAVEAGRKLYTMVYGRHNIPLDHQRYPEMTRTPVT